jgi:uncharacterized membrane protein
MTPKHLDSDQARVQPSTERIFSIRERAQGRLTPEQRLIELLTARLGRPVTVVVILAGVTVWILWNSFRRLMGAHAIDPPPFFWLQGAIGLGALVMTTMILITQNRQNREAEDRGHLDLEVNLWAEQKITKLIELIEELRVDLPDVRNRIDREAEAMKQPVDPHRVLEALERIEEPNSESAPAEGADVPRSTKG